MLGPLEGAVEHGENELLFGFGEALEALQAAEELGAGPRLAGVAPGTPSRTSVGTPKSCASFGMSATGKRRRPTS